jgi:hypothetical protein
MKATKVNHLFNHLATTRAPPDANYCALTGPQMAAFDKRQKLMFIADEIMNTESRVGDDVMQSGISKPHPLAGGNRNLEERTLVTVSRWMIGSVCQHQSCMKCGADLSRKHGIDCSGARDLLVEEFPNDQHVIEHEDNAISALLNNYCNDRQLNAGKYSKIALAIELIYQECRGMFQQENGFYKVPEPEPDPDRDLVDDADPFRHRVVYELAHPEDAERRHLETQQRIWNRPGMVFYEPP